MDRPRLLRVLLVLLLLAGPLYLWATGSLDDLSVEFVRQRLLEAGWWGGVGFLGTMATLQPLGVSVYIFLLAATLTWSAPIAIALGWTGTLLSAAISFGFARFVARDWVQKRVPDRFRRYEQRFVDHGFRTVLVLRLIFFTTPSLQLAMGASRLRFAPYMAASALGNLPTVVVAVLLGEEIAAWLVENPPETWPWLELGLGFGFVTAAVVVGWVVGRRWWATRSAGS